MVWKCLKCYTFSSSDSGRPPFFCFCCTVLMFSLEVCLDGCLVFGGTCSCGVAIVLIFCWLFDVTFFISSFEGVFKSCNEAWFEFPFWAAVICDSVVVDTDDELELTKAGSFELKEYENSTLQTCSPSMELTLSWWGGLSNKKFHPSASTRRA